MMAAKFEGTPGPWRDGPVFGKEGRAIFFTDDSAPGKWQRRLDDKSGMFSEADAKRIAAAPALLEALQRISAIYSANSASMAPMLGATPIDDSLKAQLFTMERAMILAEEALALAVVPKC